MNKTLKIVVVSVLVGCLLIISFAATGTKDNSKKTSTKKEQTEEERLNSIVKYSESLGDDERESIDKISLDEYLDLYSDEENHVILFYSDTCQYCKIALPILESIKKKYGVEINGIDVASLTNEEQKSLLESNEFFKEGVSTPLLIIVGNSKIVDQVDGLTSNENYQTFFKEYGFME